MSVSSAGSALLSGSAIVAGATAVATGISAGFGALAAKALGTRVATGAVFGAFSGAVQGAVSGICERVLNPRRGDDCTVGLVAGAATFFASTAISWQLSKCVQYDVGTYTDAMKLEGTIVGIGTGLVLGIVMVGGCAILVCKKCCDRTREEGGINVNAPSVIITV